jgi:tRNA(Arg) A34 adenosine deaminase TadA
MENLQTQNTDYKFEQWMKAAIEAAVEGIAEGESPFGAVIIDSNGSQAAVAYNRVKALVNPSAHAEVLAITSACQTLTRLQLSDCWLVTTGEPCPMCAAAASMAGIKKIVFGAREAVIRAAGYETLQLDLFAFMLATQAHFQVYGPVLEMDCTALLINHPGDQS